MRDDRGGAGTRETRADGPAWRDEYRGLLRASGHDPRDEAQARRYRSEGLSPAEAARAEAWVQDRVQAA